LGAYRFQFSQDRFDAEEKRKCDWKVGQWLTARLKSRLGQIAGVSALIT
jgi:hypothetical protein